MDKNGTLTISNFQSGIADSPLLGFAKMNNVEVFEKQGVAKIQFRTSLSLTTTSLPISIIKDNYGNTYVGCENGEFYVNGTIKINSGLAIYDMKIIADLTTGIQYLLITRNTDLAIWGPLNNAPQIFTAWNGGMTAPTLISGYGKPIVVGQDNIVYFGNGNTVASFPLSHFTSQPAGTAPTLITSAINSSALTLTFGHYVRSMSELGKWLMVGSQGGSSFYDSVNVKQARIFPWDRTSTSFNLPVILRENGINSMLQIGNQLYTNAGTRGRIYVTDSTNYQQIKRVPFTTNRQFGTTLFQYLNSFEHHNGELLNGISTGSDSFPSESIMGVYSMSLTPMQAEGNIIQYPIVMRNSPSSSGVGATQVLKIGCVYSTSNDQLYIGWQDGNTYGVDILDFHPYSNFQTIIESQFYTVGSVLDKKTFKSMEISLTNPLITGQQIRVSWRANLNDDYTVLGTYDSTNFGTNNTFRTMANLASLIKLQLKIELTQATTVAFGNNIELEYISLTGGS